MRSANHILLSILYSFASAYCFSQNTTTIRGRITDSASAEIISYATIQFSASGIYTMSNARGAFYFKIPADRFHDSIYISHVGYKKIGTLFNPGDTVLTIQLVKDEESLKEVIVRPHDPLEIIKMAIAKIPGNYSQTAFKYQGFYRLTGSKDKRVIDLSEAVFEIYHNASDAVQQFRLVKSRSEKDRTAFNGNDNIEIGQTPNSILEYDIISNIKESKLLNESDLRNYQFIFKGVVNYNNRKAYKITFDQKDGLKKSLYRGQLFIDTEDLAFLEFDYGLSPKGIQYFSWGLTMNLLLSVSRIEAKLLSDNYIVTYRSYGDKYYLNHVENTDAVYLEGGKNKFILDPLVNTTHYLVTRIDTGDVKPFDRDQILGDKKRIEFSDHSENIPGFWENYNFIPADYNVDSVIHVIQVNNATLQFKIGLLTNLRKYHSSQKEIIDSILNFYYHKGLFNGVAIITRDGKTVYEKGFGMANQEKAIANTGETQFLIGSVSKQFTSMLIMQLVHEGKLSLQDPVGEYLPDYVHGNVTIDQLLSHRSGIPNYTENTDYLARLMTKKYTPDQLVLQFCGDTLDFAPGTSFHYSNSGYVVLADVLEKVLKKNYADILSEKIFIPLNMKHSYFISGEQADNKAIGYVNDLPEKYYPIENVVGAGGITSMSEDLAIWSNALLQNKLLPPDQMNELFKPRVEWNDWDAEYGYGWMTDKGLFQVSKKHSVHYHPGTEFGFYSMLVLQPDKNLTLILLNNKGEFPRFDITDLILSFIN